MDKEKLLQLIEDGETLHAIFLTGAPESDWGQFARKAAARFLLHTDDVGRLNSCPFYLEVTDYAIDPMRGVLRLLNAEAYERGRRCVVLLNVHKMTPLVQNVLLKTLEEPPEDTLLLLTGIETGVLPTIFSRCMIVRDETEPWETIADRLVREGIGKAEAELCARISDGVYGRARRLAEEESLAFRREAIGLFKQYRTDLLPLKEAAALCTRREEDEDGEEKKKARVSQELTEALFNIWLSLLSDAMSLKVGRNTVANIDCRLLTAEMAKGKRKKF